MKLLILNIDENTNKVNKIISKLDDDLFALYLNNNIFNKNLNYKLLDSYFKPEYSKKIEKIVRKTAKSWYSNIKDDLKYFDIILPELLENEFVKTWPIFLKIEILTKLIRKEKYSEIDIITEYEEDIRILKEIIRNKDIKLNYKLFKKSDKKPLKLIIKDISYKFIAKFQNYLLKIYLNKSKRKKNILFIGNARLNLSFLRLLKLNKSYNIIRAGENLGRALFTDYSNYYLTFNEFSTKEIRSKIKREKINLVKAWNKIKNDRILLFNILEPTFRKFFFDKFLRLIKYIEIIKYIGNKLDIIVTHNDVIAFEKTIVKTANKLNIPTLTMIEGFLPIKQIKFGTQFIPFSAQKMALHSENQKKEIIKKKILENRLVVTGYPDFDKYYNLKPIEKKEIYKRYNIPLDKKIVLYVGERYTKNKYESSIWAAFTQEQYKDVYRELFNSLKDFKNLFLIIKKHPSGSLEENIIKNLAYKQGFKNFIITNDLDVYNILNVSDIVINRLSTMALEAMFLRKFVIIMDTCFDSNDNFGYTEFNAALHAKKQGELKILLKKLLDNKNLQNKLVKNMDKFVKYNYINDGNSSLRMAKEIDNLIKN